MGHGASMLLLPAVLPGLPSYVASLVDSGGYDWDPQRGLFAEVMLVHSLFVNSNHRADCEGQRGNGGGGAGSARGDALYDACSTFLMCAYGGTITRDLICGRPGIWRLPHVLNVWFAAHWYA